MEGRKKDDSDISAKKDTAEKGAWLPQEDVYQERPQGFGAPPRKGPRTSFPLIGRAAFCRFSMALSRR
jgi:hypothetical protein